MNIVQLKFLKPWPSTLSCNSATFLMTPLLIFSCCEVSSKWKAVTKSNHISYIKRAEASWLVIHDEPFCKSTNLFHRFQSGGVTITRKIGTDFLFRGLCWLMLRVVCSTSNEDSASRIFTYFETREPWHFEIDISLTKMSKQTNVRSKWSRNIK